MPRDGGWDDQDPDWKADMRLALRLLRFQEQTYAEKLKEGLDRARTRQ